MKLSEMFARRALIVLGGYTKSARNTTNIFSKHAVFLSRQNLRYHHSNRSLSNFNNAPDESTIHHEESGVNNDAREPEIDYDAITKGDKELEHRLKVIVLETEVMRQEGLRVPDNSFITTSRWTELLNMSSKGARRRYLEFLFKVSKTKEKRMIKKVEKKLQYEQENPKKESEERKCLPIEEHALQYGFNANNIFLRIYDSTINNMYNNKLIQAMQYGEKLVIDCGYDQNMTKRENHNSAKQIMLVFAENRLNKEPFDIQFCNVNRESEFSKMLKKYMPTLDEPDFPLNIHENSYLDLYPKEKLIYLTPHCQEEMTHYDPNAVYIIGAIVDKVNQEPLSLAKAKREGLKMCKFPLDRYLQWGSGSGKSLTINHCVSILLDLKETGDWKYSLRHVPRRKLADTFISSPGTKFSNRTRNSWVPKSNETKEKSYSNTSQNKFKRVNISNVFDNK